MALQEFRRCTSEEAFRYEQGTSTVPCVDLRLARLGAGTVTITTSPLAPYISAGVTAAVGSKRMWINPSLKRTSSEKLQE